MKIAIISLGSESSYMIARACKKYFDKVDMLDIRRIQIDTNTNGLHVYYNEKELEYYDCIYARGSSRYAILLRSLTTALNEKSYIPFKPETFTIGHDKFLTLLHLQKNNIPIPKTHVAATIKWAKKILDDIKYPAIIKTPAGTHGKGVMFADSKTSAKTIIDALESFKQPYIIQEFVDSNATDVRVIVANGKVIGSMKRIAEPGDIRANIHSGGSGEKIKLTKEQESLVIKGAKIIGADICGVDILQGVKDYIIEINLSPGVQGITKFTGIDVSDGIAKALCEAAKEFIKNKKKSLEDAVVNQTNAKKNKD